MDKRLIVRYRSRTSKSVQRAGSVAIRAALEMLRLNVRSGVVITPGEAWETRFGGDGW